MAKVSIKKHPMRVKTPIGDEAFILESFQGVETISEPFRFQLTLLNPPDNKFTFDKLLGQKITVTLQMPAGKLRQFHGVVNRLIQGPEVRVEKKDKPWVRYQAEMVPEFLFLKKNVRSQIFQQQTVPDILKKVLTGVEVSWKIDGTFEPRDYCVQYRESDFDFASRLMEEEGIYYFFTHTDSSHQMTVANTPANHTDVDEPKKIKFDDVAGGQYNEDIIFIWEKDQAIRAGKITLWDYNFEMPDKHLECSKEITETATAGTVDHKLKVAGNDKFEIYDYPGGYAGRFDGIAPGGAEQADKLQKIFDDNKRTVGIRMDQETLPGLSILGRSSCKQLSAGHKFTLDKHYHGDGAYVLTRVEHSATIQGTTRGGIMSGAGGKLNYANRFLCIPATVPFRPPQVTPKARIEGMQTAIVVGPSDQEIFTDKYSRVKVQFNWDRDGKKDINSSCWIRVGTPWAGKQWGLIHIPRIGMEVIVAFLEGDPNQPIIVGSVYNNTMMPPYKLPDNQTQSGLKTRTTLKGEEENYNEFRFEDKKDSEEILLHAEKDFTEEVEHNHSLKVGSDKDDKGKEGSQTIEIYKDRTETLKTGNDTVTLEKGNRTVTLKEGNDKLEVTKGQRDTAIEKDDTLEVKSGNHVVKVDKGDDQLTVGQGSQTIEINKDCSLTIKTGDYTIKVSAGKMSVEAAQSIELKVGGSSVKLEPAAITLTSGASSIKLEAAAITIKSAQVNAQGDATVEVKSPMTTVKGDGMLTLKGGMTMIN